MQVSPKEGRDCNTMSILDLVFEQLTPMLPCGSWMVKTILSPGLGMIYWCSSAPSHPQLPSCEGAQPGPGTCCSLRRTLLSVTQTACGAPERHCEHARCVSERWREKCLGWYNTGYPSIALPDPERACGWGSKLERAGWLLSHRQPPLWMSFFLALAAARTSGQSLRIGTEQITPSCIEWKNLPEWGTEAQQIGTYVLFRIWALFSCLEVDARDLFALMQVKSRE